MPDDSLTDVCTDLLQLRDEIDNSEHRPAADEICARLTQLASRIEAIETATAWSLCAYAAEVTPAAVPAPAVPAATPAHRPHTHKVTTPPRKRG